MARLLAEGPLGIELGGREVTALLPKGIEQGEDTVGKAQANGNLMVEPVQRLVEREIVTIGGLLHKNPTDIII